MSLTNFGKSAAAIAAGVGLAGCDDASEQQISTRDLQGPTPLVQTLTADELAAQNQYRIVDVEFGQHATHEPLVITIQFGDRLENIAEGLIKEGYTFRTQEQNPNLTYNETIQAVAREIAAANNHDDVHTIYGGQKFAIPYLTRPDSGTSVEPVALNKRTATYEVQAGDTLYGISASFREIGFTVSMEQIARASGLTSIEQTIHPGDVLTIPLDGAATPERTASVSRPAPAASSDYNLRTLSVTTPSLNQFELSQSFIEHLQQSEGLRLTAYTCSGGKCTIGYGHTTTAEPGQRITRFDADRLLALDLQTAQRRVAEHVQVPLTQAQYEAFVDMTFNLGNQLYGSTDPVSGQWQETNTSRVLNSLDVATILTHPDQAVAATIYENWKSDVSEWMAKWNKAGGAVAGGLVTRRAENVARFSLPSFSEWKASALKQLN